MNPYHCKHCKKMVSRNSDKARNGEGRNDYLLRTVQQWGSLEKLPWTQRIHLHYVRELDERSRQLFPRSVL